MEGIGDAVQMVKDNKEQIRDIMDTCSKKHTGDNESVEQSL